MAKIYTQTSPGTITFIQARDSLIMHLWNVYYEKKRVNLHNNLILQVETINWFDFLQSFL